MKYRIIFFNYYHYQPGSNIIIVYCKHITHARTHGGTHARRHARTHGRTHARMDARTHARTHARTDARTDAHTDARTHTRTHRCTHARTHARTHALCQPTVTARSAVDNFWLLAIGINTGTGGPVSPRF